MPLGRAVPDFTAIARSSLQEALADDFLSSDLPILSNASPLQAFIGHLYNASTLRHSARLAGVNRPEAKDVLRRVSSAGTEHQIRSFARLTLGGLCHRAAWAFSAKQRHEPPRRLDRFGQDSVWTHVCIDDATRLIPLWFVGPNPPAALTVIATEIEARWPGTALRASAAVDVTTQERGRKAVGESLTLRTWLDSNPRGFVKKVNLHAQALAFFVLHHNFCRRYVDGGGTPAMLHGLAERPWTAGDVAALALERETARRSA